MLYKVPPNTQNNRGQILMCKVMHWQLGITACKTRVEPEVQGVMPSCQGITLHKNPGIMRGSNDFKGAVEPSHCMVAISKF
jgi:hypothetical protein